ncbi:MAG: hypothetical protein HY433_00685 [Candidatus Liptonbacteria bacterium]|nr:hypothetical protein [Candidatus Liptonbacteria bacterium]
MDEQEKPFDTVSIVLLMTIAGFSDGTDLATALLFPVPVIGQVTYLGNSFLVSPITYAVIQGWFIMKTHGKKASLSSFTSFIPVMGGLGNIVNVPGSELISTIVAIWMANNPKVAALATVAEGAVAGGAGAVAGETALAGGGASAGAVAAETGAGVAAAGAETTAVGAETGASAGRVAAGAGETGGTAETGGMERGKGVSRQSGETADKGEGSEKEISDEALGEEKNPFEKLQELTEKTPDSGQKEDGDEDEDQSVNIDDEANEVDLKKAARG